MRRPTKLAAPVSVPCAGVQSSEGWAARLLWGAAGVPGHDWEWQIIESRGRKTPRAHQCHPRPLPLYRWLVAEEQRGASAERGGVRTAVQRHGRTHRKRAGHTPFAPRSLES
jgi:hypothetical protein